MFIPFLQHRPKLGSFINYRISAVVLVLGFGKSYPTTSKIALKDCFCENFFHYGSRKAVDIFAEFNH